MMSAQIRRGIWEKAFTGLVTVFVRPSDDSGSRCTLGCLHGGLAGLISHNCCQMTNALGQIHSELTELFLRHGLVSSLPKAAVWGFLRDCARDSPHSKRFVLACPRVAHTPWACRIQHFHLLLRGLPDTQAGIRSEEVPVRVTS